MQFRQSHLRCVFFSGSRQKTCFRQIISDMLPQMINDMLPILLVYEFSEKMEIRCQIYDESKEKMKMHCPIYHKFYMHNYNIFVYLIQIHAKNLY